VRKLEPHTVLSLDAAVPEVGVGSSTTVSESFTNNGTSDVKKLRLSLSARPGWLVKALGAAGVPLLAPGKRFTVAYRVSAPPSAPPLVVSIPTGAASYDPIHGRQNASVTLGELVSSPVRAPLSTADVTTHPASFGAVGRHLAISARGLGVFNPPYGAAQTDSYAAIYERAAAKPSSTAQVTVTSDPAGGASGGAGLIERDDMTAGKHSRAAVVLYVSGQGTVVMAWNAAGGADVDSHLAAPSVIVRAPVGLRLVRRGRTYTGYYSTDRGRTWGPVGTVTVAAAAAASAGRQDVGVFHASGLSTWLTTARFRDFRVR
jgi:hypothetical protein